MRRLWKPVVIALTMFPAGAVAQQAPPILPEPEWIAPVDPGEGAGGGDSGAVRVMLSDVQFRFGAAEDETYSRSVYRITSPQGLVAGAMALNWNPETEELRVHKLNIRRGDQVIDVLARQDFVVLRRETNLENAMLNGVLTASLQPEGLKVGDIVDVSTTLVRRDPVMRGRSESTIMALSPSPIDRLHARAIWREDSPMTWQVSDDVSGVKTRSVNGQTEVLIDWQDVKPARFPEGAPVRFFTGRMLEFSEFKSWAEVSQLFAPLYQKASTLSADSDLRAEIDRIKKLSPDPAVRAAAALTLVQEQVRYVFLGMELGALKPAEADRTWARRFGDCKGKTALLLALLRELGVEAEPALVSTVKGDGLDSRLPGVGNFDHVIVRAVIGGKTYWLDGTRSGDASLALLRVPPFQWALPVRSAGSDLERLVLQPLSEPDVLTLLDFDVTAGLEALAKVRAEVIMRGDSASAYRLALANVPASELESSLREYWSTFYPTFTPGKVSHAFDAARGEFRLALEGEGELDWTEGWGRSVYEIDGASMGGQTDFRREDAADKDVPWAVMFPYFTRSKTVVRLPDGGKGWSIRGDDIDELIGGAHYLRTTTLESGVVAMEASVRSDAPEFPGHEAEAVSKAMRALATERMFVIAPASGTVTVSQIRALAANGGQDLVDAIDEISELIAVVPDRAEYHAARAELYWLNQEHDKARTDIDRAIALQPENATNHMLRAAVRRESDTDGKRIDIAMALTLQPDSAPTLIDAAQRENEIGGHEQALVYLDKALALRPGDPSVMIEKGETLARAGRSQEALSEFAKARTAIAGDARLLNELCWAKGTENLALDTALEDCNAALAVRPDFAAALDSRALVELRMGLFDKAIASYDAALDISPRMAASLYGRGIAKIRKGLRIEGEDDLAMARDVSLQIDARFARYGLTP